MATLKWGALQKSGRGHRKKFLVLCTGIRAPSPHFQFASIATDCESSIISFLLSSTLSAYIIVVIVTNNFSVMHFLQIVWLIDCRSALIFCMYAGGLENRH